MSKYNKSEEFWKNYTINNITIIKKIGETNLNKGNNYHYLQDVLLAKCSCGYEYEVFSHAILYKKPKCCTRCNRGKAKGVGTIINNLKCVEVFQTRNKSGRSIVSYKLICQKCNTIKELNADTFTENRCHCSNCNLTSFKTVGRKVIPSKYFSILKYNAKKRDIELIITLEDIVRIIDKQNYKCNLSGLDISFEDGTASLDRIDSSKGYVEGNIQWVHRDINFMKNSYTQERFLEICAKVTSLNKKI